MSQYRFPAHRPLTTDERREWDSCIQESELSFAPGNFCRFCQGELPDNCKICPSCGAHIKSSDDCLRPDLADVARMGVGA